MNRRFATALAILALFSGACAATPKSEDVNVLTGLSIGEEHGCLIETQYGSDGFGPERSVVWCWGDGRNGELGDGTGGKSPFSSNRLDASGEKFLPSVSTGAVQVLGIENAVSVTVVNNHTTCAVAGDTGLYCWGEARPIGLDRGVWNSMGSSSGKAGENRLTPEKIMDGVDLFESARIDGYVPEMNYACITHAFIDDTGVYCWGAGLGTYGAEGVQEWIDTPARIAGLPDGVRVSDLALEAEGACALLEDRSIWCWSENAAPARVDEREYRSIASSRGRTCAVSFENAVYCWGENFMQWYGNGGYGSGVAHPTELDRFGLIAPDEPIAVGKEHVCLSYRHGVYCYGSNRQGQLGDGGSRGQERLAERVAVRGLGYPNWGQALIDAMPGDLGSDRGAYLEISELVATENGSCAIVYERVVACWGDAPLMRPDGRDNHTYETPALLTFNR